METQKKDIDQIFDFNGLWDLPSKCGLKIVEAKNNTIIFVTELYKENRGTSIADVSTSLAKQICDNFNIKPESLLYIERSPETKSKLSFYGEKNYMVAFDIVENSFTNPAYKELDADEMKSLLLGQVNNKFN